ncbi:DUF6884 domain-containing protein [Terrilactibacillus laevilacticus]|uniref:DUF6884 domain-containing protein n=1 Tax=Terrilactibacillus laevilacticus TaxID=1380157 RepID=A0ABW5PSY9_9BACI|nr:DUF6884 domain-containing protein [Terrilactibacillus laevilacticus]
MKKKVALMATARKKSKETAPVIEFYQSPLFKKSVQYALENYDTLYFYNAKDGLLLPDTVMAPYDVSIRTFSNQQRRKWGEKVVKAFCQYEKPDQIQLYLHGGNIYRKYLEPVLHERGFTFEIPLKGLGIGQQLKWYDKKLKGLKE